MGSDRVRTTGRTARGSRASEPGAVYVVSYAWDGAGLDEAFSLPGERGTSEFRRFPDGSGVGEAVFVPSAPDSAEDDGYLMTLAFDPVRQGTDLVVIASQDFTGEPVATVHLPVRVPLGFHGSWAPDLG